MACCNRTRGPGFKLKEGQFRLDMWKKLFTIMVVKLWNRLLEDVVDAPWNHSKAGALSNLISLKMSLSIAEGLA